MEGTPEWRKLEEWTAISEAVGGWDQAERITQYELHNESMYLVRRKVTGEMLAMVPVVGCYCTCHAYETRCFPCWDKGERHG